MTIVLRWTEWIKVDISDPAEDNSSAVQNAGLWLHNQAATDVTVCKLSPVDLRENSTWGGSIRMSMHQSDATSLPFQTQVHHENYCTFNNSLWSVIHVFLFVSKRRKVQEVSVSPHCDHMSKFWFSSFQINSVFNKKVTLTVDEAVLVWTSSRVGAPWLQKRKWSVSLAPTARTCSRSPSGGNTEDPGFNSTDNWGRRRETNLSIISTNQNRERQKRSGQKRVVIIWQVNN